MRENVPLKITRHGQELTTSEAAEVVGIVADLVVAYLRKRGGRATSTPGRRCCTSVPNGKEILS